MTGFLLCGLSLVATFLLARRSLRAGFGALLAVGYFYGLLRARIPDTGTYFLFDAAVVGLYAGYFSSRWPSPAGPERRILPWVKLLVAWPILLFLLPLQNPLVQLVGLRAAIFFLPCLLLGARASERDLDQLTRWLAVLNLVAFAFAFGEFRLGLVRFYPINEVTQLIYLSDDVAGHTAYRIPAIFVNAHAYAGTMVATLPFLLNRIQGALVPRLERLLILAAIGASCIGIFMAAARLPVVILFAEVAVLLLFGRLSGRARLAILAVGLLVAFAVSRSERLQRFTSLSDTEMVSERVGTSVNLSFFDILAEYPLGAGLGRAAGTNIPYFLSPLAKPQVGIENEFGRILLEQSPLGLLLWLAFLLGLLRRRPRPVSPRWRLGTRTIRLFVALSWMTAAIGTGLLAAVPITPLLLFEMGLLGRVPPLAAQRRRSPATGALPPADLQGRWAAFERLR